MNSIQSENDSVVIASEHSAFGSFVDTYIALNNHDVFEITKDDTGKIQYNHTIQQYETRIHHHEQVLLEPEGFENWMLKRVWKLDPSGMNLILKFGNIWNDALMPFGISLFSQCIFMELLGFVLILKRSLLMEIWVKRYSDMTLEKTWMVVETLR